MIETLLSCTLLGIALGLLMGVVIPGPFIAYSDRWLSSFWEQYLEVIVGCTILFGLIGFAAGVCGVLGILGPR